MPEYIDVGEPPLDRPIQTRYFTGRTEFGAAYHDSFWHGDVGPHWRPAIDDLFKRLNRCVQALLLIEDGAHMPELEATEALNYTTERNK